MKTQQPSSPLPPRHPGKKSPPSVEVPGSPSDAAFVTILDNEINELGSAGAAPKGRHFVFNKSAAAGQANPKAAQQASSAEADAPVFIPLSSPVPVQAAEVKAPFCDLEKVLGESNTLHDNSDADVGTIGNIEVSTPHGGIKMAEALFI